MNVSHAHSTHLYIILERLMKTASTRLPNEGFPNVIKPVWVLCFVLFCFFSVCSFLVKCLWEHLTLNDDYDCINIASIALLICVVSFFSSIFYWLCYYGCPNVFPFAPLHQVLTFLPAACHPQFMSVSPMCKFFDFSLSYTVLNSHLSILFLPIMLLFKKYCIYLFLDRGEGRERELEWNINVWLPLTYTPYWGTGMQPRNVPWLGIEPLGSQAGTQSTEAHQQNQLCFFITTSFPPSSPFPLPADNPPNYPHTYDSVPVLVVCLVCLWF